MAAKKSSGAKAGAGKKSADKKAGAGKADWGAQSELARKIWLAGVGAYDQAQDAAGKLATGAGESFSQLVARGQAAEEALLARTAEPRDKLAKAMEAFAARAQTFTEDQAAALQAGFGKAQESLGKVRKSVGDSLGPLNVAALGEKIETLSARVEALSKEVEGLKKPKAAAKPAAAKAAAPPKPAPRAKAAPKPKA
jgi:hypothetical protein